MEIIYIKQKVIFSFFRNFRAFQTFRMYFDIIGVFSIINCYFEYGIRIRCI